MLPARPCLVLDTNIVLDVFLFGDAAAAPVRAALAAGTLDWVATAAMREELARVLAYPQIVPRLAFYGLAAHDVLARFDRHARLVAPAQRVAPTCRDADDQKFLDLAAAHGALLLSKDRQVLRMARRMAPLGARVASVLAGCAGAAPA